MIGWLRWKFQSTEQILTELRLVMRRLEAVEFGLAQTRDHFNRMENRIMATFQDVITKVAQQKTLIASLTAFVQGLQDKINNQVRDLTPEQQATLDGVFNDLDSANTAIANALVANTPSAGSASAGATGSASAPSAPVQGNPPANPPGQPATPPSPAAQPSAQTDPSLDRPVPPRPVGGAS